MDRTVPRTGSEDIELYMRTYYSLLRSTTSIQIETLEESHKAMESSLHVGARAMEPDIAALTYATLRLPSVMPNANHIVIGQIEKSFVEAGFTNIEHWERVFAPGRRRRVHYDGKETLAVFIASRSDIDDLVPILTAYQIEWNKLHNLLQSEVAKLFLSQHKGRTSRLSASEIELLANVLQMEEEDIQRLELIWPDFFNTLQKIAQGRKRIALKLLASTVADYRKATAYWWDELEDEAINKGVDPQLRPIYFVSSNTHCLPNLLSGFAWRHEKALISYVEEIGHEDLLEEYHGILNNDRPTNRYNFLYYILKKYLADRDPGESDRLRDDEHTTGIYRVLNRHGFQIESQIIEINKLRSDWLDPRLCDKADFDALSQSDALIINIDYPLGLAAYEILNRVTEQVGNILGAYVLGKAATLNGRIGDVMIPNVIHDEHSHNTYIFNNCFTAHDVTQYMAYGMVLDNQKAISAPGTFLQNSTYMDVFYQEGYTDIEMEGGPYLSSIYEAYRPNRHPQNEIVNLYGVPFDVGFLHYASDTPMSRAHNLGTSNLSYIGVDPTYATAIAILRRILAKEAERMRKKQPIPTAQATNGASA